MAVQADGKIVVVGDSGQTAVVRLNADGTPDAGFGAGGSVVLNAYPQSPSDVASAIAAEPDGGLVVAGSAIFPSTAYDVVVTRLRADGTLDDRFGAGGRASVPIGPGGSIEGVAAHGLALLPDGRIFVAGYTLDPDLDRGNLVLVGMLVTGALDPMLAGHGILTLGLGAGVRPRGRSGGDGVDAVSGRRLGTASNAPEPRRDRAGPDGAPETAFAPRGVLDVPIGDPSDSRDAVGIARRPDGRIALLARLLGEDSSAFGIALVDPSPAEPPGGAVDGGPRSRIARIPSVVRPRNVRRFTGTARASAGVARVQVALVRHEPGRRPACGLLRQDRRRFRRVFPSSDGGCTRRIWIRATGTGSWRLRLRCAPRPGSYVAFSRATDAAGRAEVLFSRPRGNRVAFRVR